MDWDTYNVRYRLLKEGDKMQQVQEPIVDIEDWIYDEDVVFPSER